MIKKIDHINISVTNIEVSKNFFINLLGFELIKEGILEGDWIDNVVGLKNVKAKYSQLAISNSETNLELIQYDSPTPKKDGNINKSNQIGFRHIAFEVKDIEKLYQKLKDSDVEFFSKIQTYNINKKLCYFKGPDNIILELAEYKD